ncbi:hypothetical protein J2S49_001116 [Arcanobacterium wilhelmae]|uniref:Uncharacterized protein n=1 Tax=Arcanobacterium wilhelmae TaxID=1803177 RepID=A0ABT9NBH1_9ACTO|nr:hypothetical protein [Arcanobacterium wilhelmae]
MKILPSAHRHGATDIDIAHAWKYYITDFYEGYRPTKVLRLGWDTNGRLLEIGATICGQAVTVFHAMRARKLYIERIGS